MLKGKTIVVGISGGIAAYKAVEVVSRLRKQNADVYVVMTENATKFVTPLTFQSISHNLVSTDMYAPTVEWDIEHISLAKKADIVLVVPATANLIGKISNGIADDLLTTTIMATKAPVIIAPAMNFNMYENPVVQENINKLNNLGYRIIEPDTGIMAEGSSGTGRLPEPSRIVDILIETINQKKNMRNLNVLITAGPTREKIDPVRFISNNSTGKMGYSIAEAAAKRGANVVMISGPVNIPAPTGVKIINTTTADSMYEAVLKNYEDAGIVIFSAAVADYKPASESTNKIKKNNDSMNIEFVRNKDIAFELGKKKGKRIHAGFSAETENLIDNAKSKLKEKNFDLIAANDVTMEGAGFGTDTNIIKLINREGIIVDIPLMSKNKAANIILDEIMKLQTKNNASK